MPFFDALRTSPPSKHSDEERGHKLAERGVELESYRPGIQPLQRCYDRICKYSRAGYVGEDERRPQVRAEQVPHQDTEP